MILVTGATGFVGQALMKYCDGVIASPSLRDMTEDEMKRMVEESGAEAIIHTAAISDIGTCEANPEASYHANVEIPVFLAKAASGRKLVCFSSDQVYSGMEDLGPYSEEKVNPANIYAKHKWEMEQRVLDICPNSVMLRAEWMYHYESAKPNYFLNVMNAANPLSFSREQYRGVTYVREVAENAKKVLALPGGSYNFGSETKLSMYDITEKFLLQLQKDVPLLDALSRHNLWMNCEKARKYGVDFSTVEEGLVRCLKDYREYA